MRIAVVGGTGREGRGLALRWARKGHEVTLGSRDGERARARARELAGLAGGVILGGANEWAVEQAETVVLCVPYAAHDQVLLALKPSLRGRVLIDITVPLKWPTMHQVHLPAGQAAALEAQAIVGDETPVVAALHHVGSTQLGDHERELEGDVLVCSDSDDARARAMALIGDLGARPLDAGPLRNAIALEALTPVLIHLTQRYRSSGAGVRFIGF